jgi:LPS sulfotransferase NodH
MKLTSFVVVTLARSGSYLLIEQLRRAPGCICHGEIFKPRIFELDDHTKAAMWKAGWTKQMRDRRPRAFIDQLRTLSAPRLVGFKIFLSHNQKALHYVLEDKSCLKIFLFRNPLSRYISQLRAEATGTWVQRGDSPPPRALSLDFDPHRFEKFFVAEGLKLQALADHRGKSDAFITAEYDDVVNFRCFDAVCKALGKNTPLLTSANITMRKQTTEEYKTLVSNYSEMIEHLEQQHPELLVFA